MGIIEKVGPGVTLLKKGDRVVMPFNVADGRCLNCEEGKTAYCTGVNPGFAGGAYGYVAMGPYAGGQVPPPLPLLSNPPLHANTNAPRRNTSASPSPTSTPCPSPPAPHTNPPSRSSRTSSPPAGTGSRSRTSRRANPSPSSAPAPSG